MPTKIERSYLEQGYRLPEGCTWDMVAERRERWGIDPIFAPVAVVPACVGWGVPFVDGKPLGRPAGRTFSSRRGAGDTPADG